MWKERSGGGAAALWVEKQIWEETDAEGKEQPSTSSYTAGRNRALGGDERKSRGGQGRSETSTGATQCCCARGLEELSQRGGRAQIESLSLGLEVRYSLPPSSSYLFACEPVFPVKISTRATLSRLGAAHGVCLGGPFRRPTVQGGHLMKLSKASSTPCHQRAP